ncbi:MAG: hypothetical protein PHP37_02475 [Patescibacteria group bacterium]|nr:hypothetical protein [Patescibacteria group bacterium]
MENFEKESFADKIIEKIEKDKLSPKPKWSFLLKNYTVWFFGILSVLLGAISFSLIIYLFRAGDGLVSGNFGGSFWEIFLAIIPLFWLIFLAIFTFIAYLNIKHTRKAYKYSPLFILVSGIFISIALGSTLFMLGVSQKFDDLLGKNIHPFFYRNFINPQVDFWSDVENGRLAGVISEINVDKSFFIIDIESQKWLVYYADSSIKRSVDVRVGSSIRCFGKKISEDRFEAIEIMPMMPGREFLNRSGVKKNYHQLNP